ERRRIARVATLTVLAILVGAALIGETLLSLLGTSLSSFRIAGGLVLLLMALAMLQAKPGNVRQTQEEADDLGMSETPAIVPLAIPLLAGPGAISTVMIAVQHGGWEHQAAVIGAIGVVCLILWSMLRLAIPIGRLLGPGGFNVATRLLGLLLAAIAVQSMAIGLKELFPVLGGS
ncbi:MAG TPA: MarC family protein, partial [Rhodocyclaceae bacterium]|nr:MarC family protein [Rhodocyclaceae bacterium]